MPPKRNASRKVGAKKNRRKKNRPGRGGPLHSLLGEADRMPHSDLSRPLPQKQKLTPKTRGKQVFILESDDPLEKNVMQNSKMPDGYAFAPKGNVYITRNCRTKTKESGKMVYTVWDKAGRRNFGIRVPDPIHKEVLQMADATAESRAKAVESRDTKTMSRARALLCQEFPSMPDDDLESVLNHAFLKGSRRVGRTEMVTDKTKASLAVEAHIRHVHTSYDAILQNGTNRVNARKQVLPRVQAIKEAWETRSNKLLEQSLPVRPAPKERSKSPPISVRSSRSPSLESLASLESLVSLESSESLVEL
ncbi:hypothetical protein N7532_007046 [Penicillium argentinense]|uniref:DUF2293 domain-containing protein n=1 Tax=Penicillium argentinense TaxID=1131581 RepID=A0A9W9FH69_9EURO|nr:uncharacterized protein N7532_007046 [Penicillium argentinense]KAJ5100045.1 hypothetical protein N7532_007046 [Penicillium argentinense]